jgi:uncharacterized protein YkwD
MKKILLSLIVITTALLNAQYSEINEIVDAHNKYRSEFNIPPLKWSNKLAKEAVVWADYLSAKGKFFHSPNRNGAGENLWMGTAGHYSLSQMVERWGDEKAFYKDGIFPNVTTGGVVGHYTQMIWRNTTEVGCAKSSNGEYDYFVCRYYPPGNYIGQKVY